MKKFQLLKQTFPVSEFDRECDGYKFIIDNIPKKARNELGINDDDLQKIIKKGEKYMYRVGKEDGKFSAMTISLSNFEYITISPAAGVACVSLFVNVSSSFSANAVLKPAVSERLNNELTKILLPSAAQRYYAIRGFDHNNRTISQSSMRVRV